MKNKNLIKETIKRIVKEYNMKYDYRSEYRGYKYFIICNKYDDESWKCGYIGLTKDNPFYEKYYEDIPYIDCPNNGLTFSGYVDGDEENNWWIGFDTMDLEEYSLEDAVNVCKSIIDQIIRLTEKESEDFISF